MNPPAPMLPVRGVRFCLGLGAAGWLLMAVGWYQAAGRLRVEEQVTWSVLSVAGTTTVALVTVLLVLAGRRAVEQRLRAVLTLVADEHRPAPVGGPSIETALVAANGMARYHVPSCRLTRGKPVQRLDRAGHESAGRRPCGVCLRPASPSAGERP
jgi:hypothetical protein